MDNEIIITSSAKIWLDKDEIIRAEIKNGAKLTLEDAIENIKIFEKIGKEPRLLLADIRNIKSATKEIKGYFSSEEVSKIIPVRAILVGSPVAKVMGNVLFKVVKHLFVVKIFTSETEAIEWLKSFMVK